MDEQISNIQRLINQAVDMLIPLGTAILILLGGWLIAKLVSTLIARILNKLRVDRLADKLNQIDFLHKAGIEIKPVTILRKFIYWLIMLIFILAASDKLGLDEVSTLINQIIEYMPRLLVAVAILAIGFVVSNGIKDLVGTACKSLGIKSWKAISSVVFYLLLISITLSALNQAGVDTQLLTTIVVIVVAGVAGAFALAYGLAARNVLASILTSFYSKKSYEVGMVIEVDGHKGVITAIDQLSFSLDTGTEIVVFPLNRLMNDKVIVYQGE